PAQDRRRQHQAHRALPGADRRLPGRAGRGAHARDPRGRRAAVRGRARGDGGRRAAGRGAGGAPRGPGDRGAPRGGAPATRTGHGRSRRGSRRRARAGVARRRRRGAARGVSRNVGRREAPDVSHRPVHREWNAKVYRAALALYAKGEPVDAITLTDELEERSELEAVGGRVRLHELAALVPATANAAHYARIVRETATLRGLIRAGGEI